MTRHALRLAAPLFLLVLGCADSASPVTTLAPQEATPAVELGMIGEQAGITEAAMGLMRLEIDPDSLQATASLLHTRQAAATDDVYLLSIENFINSETLRINGVTRDADSVNLTYTITHPFAAPSNLAGPASASNRADLGVAGQLIFLLDTTGSTQFFADEGGIRAETGVIQNPHGYTAPRGLLTLPGYTANAFPYQLFVDEGQDTRDNGISNGGLGTGNYGTTGWQQGNIGATNDGWTGYGVLHQGQSSTQTLELDAIALSAGPVTIDTALLVKYNDPRGGQTATQKRANRLPSASGDITQFGYRMPHGALDVEAIEFLGESGGLMANSLSATTLSLRVRDWDARGIDTTETDLATDPVPTNVAVGESGLPSLALSVPAIIGSTVISLDNGTHLFDDDTAFGGDVGQDSGAALDELFYEVDLTNTTTSGQTVGTVTGLFRALDVEDGIDTSAWRFPLQPNLSPLSSDLPRPVRYQHCHIDLASGNLPPTMSLIVLSPVIGTGSAVTVQASAISAIPSSMRSTSKLTGMTTAPTPWRAP